VTACQRLPKFSTSQRSAVPTNTKRKDNRRRLCLDLVKTFSFLGSFLLTREQNNNGVNYHHHYSPRHLEGCGQSKEGRAMPVSLRLGMPKSRGHPPDPPLGLHCAQSRAAPAMLLALGSVTTRQPMLIRSPSGPR
jgi:hypothetical protein